MTRTRKLAGRAAAALLLSSAIALSPATAPPAHALFGGFGGIVYDPTNHAENLLTAARTLEQINNQIAQLQNEAQMLVNQARNLASLPYSSLSRLQSSVQETQRLLGEAQRIAHDVAEIDRAFTEDYGAAAARGDFDQMIAGARGRWETSVAGLEDSLKVQAGVVGNIETARAEIGGDRCAAGNPGRQSAPCAAIWPDRRPHRRDRRAEPRPGAGVRAARLGRGAGPREPRALPRLRVGL